MRLSIVIPTYNAEPYLRRCLSSIKKHLSGLEHEICVIDNASKDLTVPMIEHEFPRVTLIRNQQNLGFARAVNEGLRNTKGSYVLWLNPDTEVLDGNIAELIAYLDKEPRVAILGPQLVDSDGSVQYSCRSFPSYETALFNRYSLLTRFFPSNPYSRRYLHSDWDHSALRDVDWVSGACLMHRRELLDSIGSVDEKFFMYCEDVDFCRRAKLAGWGVRYHPALKVLHRVAGSSQHVPLRSTIERHRSIWLYYAKYFPRNPFKDLLILAGLTTRCLYHVALSSVRYSPTPKVHPR